MLGYAEDEIIALGLPAISHPDDWERDLPFVSRLWRGEIPDYHVQKRYLRKDGRALWAQLTVSLMHDEAGRPTDNVGMIEDITERKQAEEKLRSSERTLRTLMDASPESILLSDTDGAILFANATMARRFGRTADELVGLTSARSASPEVAANRTQHIQEVARTGKPLRFEDKRFDRDMENAMHPIFDDQGKVAAVAILAIDRTDGKQAEEALQKAHDELESRVRERTAELSTANERLKHLLQSSDHERQIIAYEIHDGLAQYLAGAVMQFETYFHLKDARPEWRRGLRCRDDHAPPRPSGGPPADQRRQAAHSRRGGDRGRRYAPGQRAAGTRRTQDRAGQQRRVPPTGADPGKRHLPHRAGSPR